MGDLLVKGTAPAPGTVRGWTVPEGTNGLGPAGGPRAGGRPGHDQTGEFGLVTSTTGCADRDGVADLGRGCSRRGRERALPAGHDAGKTVGCGRASLTGTPRQPAGDAGPGGAGPPRANSSSTCMTRKGGGIYAPWIPPFLFGGCPAGAHHMKAGSGRAGRRRLGRGLFRCWPRGRAWIGKQIACLFGTLPDRVGTKPGRNPSRRRCRTPLRAVPGNGTVRHERREPRAGG